MIWRSLRSYPNIIQIRTRCTESLKKASLYLHWPYCKKLCPYCDFNKYVRDDVDHKEMSKCLQREFKSFLCMYDIDHITSVYFGGGTPSLAYPSTIAAIINDAHKLCSVEDTNEITLELNPTSYEVEKLKDFKQAGVNRVSIGIQALDDTDLKVLGREHSVEEALRCFEFAYELFDGRVSIDLMFARPNQTVERWRKELEMIVSLQPNHVSLYQLTMKEGTPMAKKVKKGNLSLPSEDVCAIMYEDSIQALESFGLVQYEVSNFAKEGYQSLHNMSYWNGGDYIGIGPGAHGRLRLKNSQNQHSIINAPVPEHWMKQVKKKGHGVRLLTSLTRQEQIEEIVMLGLRTSVGICLKKLEDFLGWSSLLLIEDSTIQSLFNEKLIEITERRC